MDTPSPSRPDASLYERDFHAWCLEQAARMRERARPGVNDGLDYVCLAEEIDALAASDRRVVASHMKTVLLHLLKWQHQPAMRNPSWRLSINNARDQIEAVLADSPSLARHPHAVLGRAYVKAVRDACAETGLTRIEFPAECPFTAEQVLDPEFTPSEAPALDRPRP